MVCELAGIIACRDGDLGDRAVGGQAALDLFLRRDATVMLPSTTDWQARV